MNAKVKSVTILAILFVLVGLIAAAPSPAFAAVDGCTKTHTVVSGENLSKIAVLYETTWPALATLNKLEDPNLIYPGQVLCIFATSPTTIPPTSPPPLSGPVRVWAGSVVEDKAVTLKGKQLDSSSTYTVYLSNYKKGGLVETNVGTAQTDSAGTFTQAVFIPKSLVDISLLKVRIVNSRGDQAANWFINTTGSAGLGGIGSADIAISIDEVKEGDSVKITVSNLPANVTFHVFIAKGDSTGAILVGQIKSSDGGKVTATYDIPGDYLARTKLEIQLENDAVEMDAVKDFDNE